MCCIMSYENAPLWDASLAEFVTNIWHIIVVTAVEAKHAVSVYTYVHTVWFLPNHEQFDMTG